MEYNDIFNPLTLNIFADASVTVTPTETVGCPGIVAVTTNFNDRNIIIYKSSRIIRNSTNNNAEINAILDAVKFALNEKNNYKTINIFSDSKICIYGLREWVFGWSKNMIDERLYNSSGKEVSNQDVFKHIIHLIVSNNLRINLLHQKGHVTSSTNSLLNAAKVFGESNYVVLGNDGLDLIQEISKYNNYIDIETKEELKKFFNGIQCVETQSIYNSDYTKVYLDIDTLDIYKNLIKIKKF